MIQIKQWLIVGTEEGDQLEHTPVYPWHGKIEVRNIVKWYAHLE